MALRSSQAAVLTQSELLRLLSYDHETGIFYWRVKSARFISVGDIAGCIEAKGYRIIKIEGRCYKAHRLAWLYMTGEWPKLNIDHKDRNPSNCRWSNLREATFSQNNINADKAVGRSGLKGAAWSERAGKWKSSIRHGGRRIHLGYFDDAEKAHQAYATAAKELHSEWMVAA